MYIVINTDKTDCSDVYSLLKVLVQLPRKLITSLILSCTEQLAQAVFTYPSSFQFKIDHSSLSAFTYWTKVEEAQRETLGMLVVLKCISC